jgi:hypothetical protein
MRGICAFDDVRRDSGDSLFHSGEQPYRHQTVSNGAKIKLGK